MATTTESVSQAQSAPSQGQPGGGNQREGGRGGRAPRQNPPNMPAQSNSRGGRRGGRGGTGRARGGNGGQAQSAGANAQTTPIKPPPPDPLGGGGTFGNRLTEDAKKDQGTAEDNEAEVCFICASPVVHQALSPCNHSTCHICALRLRALYKTRACAHCRTEAKFVIFTDESLKRFEDFADGDFQMADDVLGIRYSSQEIHDDTILLLRYNCPEESCDIACLGWPDLHRHVRSQHGKFMCDMCTRNKKVFTHEHELFTKADLHKHEKSGDDSPGAVDQSGFKGHPECGFCRKRFYGDDELFVHCREKHERCHLCDARNGGRSPQYYADYNSLEAHFRKDHILCLDRECLEKKFVVFESEMDMKAHQLEVHPNGMSKDMRRDARRVDISSFDYRTPHQENRQGGRGRGRDPNAEPIPPSSAHPLRRDELAFQRQAAIVQSSQSVSNRTFGSQLTAIPRNEAPTASGPRRPNNNLPALENLNITSTSRPNSSSGAPDAGAQPAPTPQEQARRLQHAAVMERAQNMLRGDQSKVADFRTRVSSYRASTITAAKLIETFFTLFDVPSADLGKLIKELAGIYENESKRAGLLQAWNDWRAINEDYPSLPGNAGVLSGSSTGSGGRRILTLKSSTAQSSRSAVSKQAGWNNAGSSANPLAASSKPAASANRAGAGRVGSVPWAGGASNISRRPSPAPMSRQIAPASVQGPRPGKGPGSDAFPALPAAAKPNTHIFGLHRAAVRWDDGQGGTPTNPWGGTLSGEGSANAGAAASEVEGDGAFGGGGKKKGKAKKQTLYKFG